jgi:hypothetical protein
LLNLTGTQSLAALSNAVFNAGTTVQTGTLTGTGNVAIGGTGTLLVNGTTAATAPITVNSGGTLGGLGTINGLITANSGGTVAPGTSPGILNTGNLVFNSGSILSMEVNGTVPGTQHDQLNVTGTVSLGNATLSAFGTIPSSPTQQVTIINNDGADPIVGTFNGIPEGGNVNIGGVNFAVTYKGGDGNDVVFFQADSNVYLDGSGSLHVDDVSTASGDFITVQSDVANSQYIITNPGLIFFTSVPGITGSGTDTITVPFAVVSGPQMFFGTAGGSDMLKVDFTLGAFSDAVSYDGGAGGNDAMQVFNPGGGATYTPDAAVNGQGVINVGANTINFTGLEPVDFILGGTFTLLLPGANDIVNVANGSTVLGLLDALTISGSSGGVPFEVANVRGATNVIIDTTTVAGTDTVTIASANNAHLNNALTITTGAEAGDVITVNGVATFAGTTTLNAATINLNANITNAVTGTVATTINVDDNPSGQIQDGISVAAAAGATINVASGTYTENLLLNKVVTLKGAQAGVDARGRVAAETILTPLVAGNTTLDLTTGSGASVIDGFTFSGGTALSMIRSTLSAVNDNLQIVNNRFSGFTGDAIFLDKPGNDITISQNVVDGASKTSSGGAVHLDTDTFNGFYLTNNWILNGATGPGFFVDGNRNVAASGARTPLIQGNLFQGNDVGINAGSRSLQDTLITENTFADNDFDGFQGGPLNSTISKNTFSGNDRWGLSLTSFGNTSAGRGSINTVVTGNFFFNNTGMPTSGDLLVSSTMAPGAAASNLIAFNSFTSAVTISYSGTETVNASGNWFGTNVEAAVTASFGGTGVANIDRSPYLDSGTDTNAAPGFQPDFSVLHLTATGAQAGPTGRVAEVVGLIADGLFTGINRTVQAGAGTYAVAADLSIPVTVKLKGNVTINSLTGIAGTAVDLNGQTLTLGDGTSTTYPGTISGVGGSLTKQGGGTFTLSGIDTYTGATLVNAGTLSVTGSIANSAVTVAGGTSLIGTGTTGAVTVNSGGNLSPGLSPSIINTGNLVLGAGSNLIAEVNGSTPGTGHDQVNVTGTVDVTGANLITSGTITSVPSQTVVLINNDGVDAVTGTFNGLPESTIVTINGVEFVLSYVGGDGNDVTLLEAQTLIHLDGSGNLVVDDVGSGNNDLLTLQSDTTNSRFVINDPVLFLTTNIPGATGNGTHTVFVPFAAVTGANVFVNTFGGNDSLNVNFALGNFSKAVSYDGGVQTVSDSLTLSGGGTFASVLHTFISNSAGNVTITGNSLVSYVGLEPVIDNLNAANRQFDFTGGTETISLTDTGGADGNSTIDSTLGESVTFANPTTSLTINGGTGDDTISITSIDAAYAGSLTVNGDAATDNITLGAGLPTFTAVTTTSETIAALPALTVGAGGLSITASTGAISVGGTLNVTGTVTLNALANGVALNADINASGDVFITAGGGNITHTTGTITTGNVTLSAVAGNIGAVGAGAAVQTSVNTIVSTSSGNQFLAEASGLTAVDLNAGGSDITLTLSAGSLTDVDGATDVTADDFTLTAPLGIGSGANPLQTSVNGLATVGIGNQFILEANGLTALNLNGGGSVITLTLTAGAVNDADGATDIASNDLFLTAPGGIGTGANPIHTSVDTLTTTTTNADQFITESNGIAGNLNLAAGTGDITLTLTAGAVNDADGANDVTADDFTLTAPAGIGTGANPLQTTVNTLTTSTTNTDQFVTESNGLNAINLAAGTGDITLVLTAGAVTDTDAGVDATANVFTVTAPGGIGSLANPIATSVNSLIATTTNADQFFSETNGLTQLNAGAGTGDVTLILLAGALADTDGATDVTANDFTVTAPGGIGSLANPIATNVDTLTTSTTNTNQFFTETNGLTALNVSAGTGDITVTLTAGAVTDVDGAVDAAGNSVTLTAPGGLGSGANPLQTSVNSLTTTTTNTDQFLTESNGLTALNMNAGTGDITLALAAGAVTDIDGAVDLAANDLIISAPAGLGTPGSRLQTSVDTIASLTANASQFFLESNSVALNLMDAGSGNVFLDAVNAITDNNAAANNIAAVAAVLTTGSGIGISANPIRNNHQHSRSFRRHGWRLHYRG